MTGNPRREACARPQVPMLALCAPYLLLLLASCAWMAVRSPSMPPDTPVRCFERIASVLADDAMEGRGVATAGLERAARYLEQEFRDAGLDGGARDYRQAFPVVTGVELGEHNALAWQVGASPGATPVALGSGFTPLGFSSSGEFSGSLVFAGYGIRAESLGYDDYAGLDVAGKVVLAMRYEPGERDEASPFDGKHTSRWSDLRYKSLVARENGAAALLFVSPPASDPDEPDRLPPLKSLGPVSRAGLPVLQVSREVANRWLATGGLTLGELRATIEAEYRPRSLELDSIAVRGRVDVRTTEASVRNVVGVLPGRGALADQAVVVGAHYDHLGYGGHGSMEPGVEAIHNGADDNASGVAAMACAARDLSRSRESLGAARRTLVVAAFAAEEIGLGGSSRYVRDPIVPLERTYAMVNLDMVGRLRDRQLSAIGADSAKEWQELLEHHGREAGLALSAGGEGYGPSDQTPFYEKGIPVVHLFTGAHEDYHTPRDDLDTLNLEGSGEVTLFVAKLLEDLLTRTDPLSYVAARHSPSLEGDRRGYGAYLGTIPDYTSFTAREGGVLLSSVRPGGPADRAGLRGGDLIVEMAGVTIENLYDMTFVLQDHKPGETIEISVVRDGERVTLRATLGRRGPAQDAEGGAAPPGRP